jgi:hypothetical protein
MTLSASGLLRIAEQIRAGNVMVNADLATAQTAEIFLSIVGAGTMGRSLHRSGTANL